MSRLSSEPARRIRRMVAAVFLLVLASVAAALPQAASASVKITRVYAQPIDAAPSTLSDPTDADAQNQRYLCKAEPTGRWEYGTFVPFDDTRDQANGRYYPTETNYVAPNNPSTADLTPDLQAGSSADLCLGFTLTPNMDPKYVRTATNTTGVAQRLTDATDPTLADDADTHVGWDDNGTPGDATDDTPIDGDDMKSVTVDLPNGFAAAPDDAPTCTDQQFGIGQYKNYLPVPTACDAAVVGTVYARLWAESRSTVGGSALHIVLVGGGQANPASGLKNAGMVYNLAHGPNELARLALAVQPASGIAPVKVLMNVKLQPDGHLRATVEGIPNRTYVTSAIDQDDQSANYGQPVPGAFTSPIYVESLGVRVWGRAADHGAHQYTSNDGVLTTRTSGLTKDFAQWGTDCADSTKATVQVTTQKNVVSTQSSTPFNLTGCSGLSFVPSVDVTTSETKPGVPTGATIRVNVAQSPAGQQRTAMLRNASVTLPKGLEIGAQVASVDGGLKLCTAAQFAKDSTADNTCPASSAQGKVTIQTPLLATPFTGSIYLGEQSAVGELPALYLQAQPSGSSGDDAPRIKLVGTVKANDDGTLTTTFTDAPQLRFSQIQLEFPKGDHALFVTPRTCGVASATSTFTAWSGQTVNADSSVNITDCTAAAFNPTISMTPDDATVGASSPTTITIARPDTSPWLKGVSVSLPTGFLADLNAASECPTAQANANACPDSSRIGSVSTVAGAGNAPLTLNGAMYLVERQEGAVAGAAIVVRAKLGELDLGDVVVPARIDLRPTDAGLTLTTTAPTRFHNLALFLRSITVRLDRSGFPLNPTACGPLRATANLTADTGETAAPTADVTYNGCAARPFQPAIKAEFVGDIKEKSHPAVHVVMTPRKGDSNLRSTTVLLPEGAAADLTNIKNPCANDAFNAGTCPAASRVGTAKATVAITPDSLTGDVYLVKVDGERLPGIGMSFTGRYTQRILSRVKVDSKTGRLATAFESIPDLPLTGLDLTVDGGAKSPIVLSADVCKNATSWDATFGGQGGQTSKQSIAFDCSNPAITPTSKWSRKSGLALTFKAPTGKTLKSVKVTIPTGFKIVKTKSSLKKNVKITATGGKVKSRITSRTITLTQTGSKSPTTIKLTLKPKGYALTGSLKKKGLKKGSKLKVESTTTLTGSTKSTSTTVTTKVS